MFDVYINRQREVKIIDFNPWASHTESLLFEWTEILESTVTNPQIKVIESEEESRGKQPAYLLNRLPKEAFDFSANGASIAEFAEEFNQQIAKQILTSK